MKAITLPHERTDKGLIAKTLHPGDTDSILPLWEEMKDELIMKDWDDLSPFELRLYVEKWLLGFKGFEALTARAFLEAVDYESSIVQMLVEGHSILLSEVFNSTSLSQISVSATFVKQIKELTESVKELTAITLKSQEFINVLRRERKMEIERLEKKPLDSHFSNVVYGDGFGGKAGKEESLRERIKKSASTSNKNQ